MKRRGVTPPKPLRLSRRGRKPVNLRKHKMDILTSKVFAIYEDFAKWFFRPMPKFYVPKEDHE